MGFFFLPQTNGFWCFIQGLLAEVLRKTHRDLGEEFQRTNKSRFSWPVGFCWLCRLQLVKPHKNGLILGNPRNDYFRCLFPKVFLGVFADDPILTSIFFRWVETHQLVYIIYIRDELTTQLYQWIISKPGSLLTNVRTSWFISQLPGDESTTLLPMGLWSISHEISGSRHFPFFQRRLDAEKNINPRWVVEPEVGHGWIFLEIMQEVQWILRYFFQKWGATTIGQQTSTPNSDRWLHIYRSAGDHSTAGAGTAVFFWWIFEANSARNGKSACWYQWCGPCNNQDNRSKVLKGSFYSKFWRRLLPWQIFLKNGCRINHHLKQLWQLFSWTCYIYIYMYVYIYIPTCIYTSFVLLLKDPRTYHDTRSTSRKKIRKGGECDRAAGMHLPAN